jgi:hypothetical protein
MMQQTYADFIHQHMLNGVEPLELIQPLLFGPLSKFTPGRPQGIDPYPNLPLWNKESKTVIIVAYLSSSFGRDYSLKAELLFYTHQRLQETALLHAFVAFCNHQKLNGFVPVADVFNFVHNVPTQLGPFGPFWWTDKDGHVANQGAFY